MPRPDVLLLICGTYDMYIYIYIYAVNWCVSRWNGRDTMEVINIYNDCISKQHIYAEMGNLS